MKPAVIADNLTIIHVQGVRFAEKIGQVNSNFGPDRYRLRVTYKGDVLDYAYPDVAQRDAQYNALRIALGVPSQTSLGDAMEPAKATTASAAKE